MLLKGPHSCGTPLRYDNSLLEMIPPILGDTCRLIQRLTMPTSRAYVRVNTLKISVREYLRILEEAGYSFSVDEEIPEAIWTPIQGPFPITPLNKKVIADKRASENVMLGSDLYIPGVVGAKNVKKGDKVTIVAPNGIPVANGIAIIDYHDVIQVKRRAKRGRLGLFVKVTESLYRTVRVGDLPGFNEGYIYGQSLSSMYVARLLDPQPHEWIIDITAAPGGKISHAAQLAGPKARIVAVDRPSKVEKLKETFTRLGMNWIQVLGGDSRYLTVDHPSLTGKFDKVILDPPCTNLGVIPKVVDNRSHRDARNLVSYQFQLAKTAAKLLKKGGILAYSVCTLTYPEAEAQALRISEELGFEPIEPEFRPVRPIRTSYGYWLSPLLHDVTGFYISLLRKK
ncbi:MAG: RsmB/NOP family class I SAM-dependent RNA methyltransferase [Desulfurococcales archaeon]|nr:RsmB/NOP family class I SAM-dependent RNA methyltransferase [Desulfurococcales archaeon]